ncbi:hypothetical protein GCM10010990_14800 [Croceicoccus mobilis]|uniref:Uncharacterized protein n=1 Tax=Croceicoccus mobilis TaxID=1703339 RepID=A0A916YY91_9SPHN|nr:hypothetical protein GCM10010990_14800 [Croceicoccus mobilis]
MKPFLNELVHEGLGFEDFRTNGLLLPGTEKLALKQGLPLHRGPHRLYNEMVLERVGAIEMAWSEAKNGRTNLSGIPDKTRRARANAEAMERLGLLQRALRRRLVSSSGKPMVLNRKDPIGANIDFSHLDAMAETLWQDTSG